MTDNDIIKALESEVHLVEYVDGFSADNISLDLLKSTLDLINRLQAENKELAESIHNLTIEKDELFDRADELNTEVERLKSMNQSKLDTIHELRAEIEQLDEDRNNYQNLYCMTVKDLETVKSEAVKGSRRD